MILVHGGVVAVERSDVVDVVVDDARLRDCRQVAARIPGKHPVPCVGEFTEGLDRRGAQVDVVEAYRTEAPADAAKRAGAIFTGRGRPDWITFTSSSTVKNFVECAGRDVLDGVRVASIGPVTSATVRGLGIKVAVEAGSYTIDGLVEAILLAALPAVAPPPLS